MFWGLKKPIRLRKSSESSNRRMSFRAAKSPGSSPKVESKHTRNILRKQMHPMISEIADEPGLEIRLFLIINYIRGLLT